MMHNVPSKVSLDSEEPHLFPGMPKRSEGSQGAVLARKRTFHRRCVQETLITFAQISRACLAAGVKADPT